MASSKDKQKIYFTSNTAYKIVNGKRVTVPAIVAPEANDCCKLNCCDKTIDYISPTTEKLVKIPLDDIAKSLGLI